MMGESRILQPGNGLLSGLAVMERAGHRCVALKSRQYDRLSAL